MIDLHMAHVLLLSAGSVHHKRFVFEEHLYSFQTIAYLERKLDDIPFVAYRCSRN